MGKIVKSQVRISIYTLTETLSVGKLKTQRSRVIDGHITNQLRSVGITSHADKLYQSYQNSTNP